MKKLFTLFFVVLLTGCASDRYKVGFDSNPRNAAVICNGRVMGYTPTALSYPRAKITNGIPMSECIAQWSSGVSTKYQDATAADVARYPNGIGQTVQRESGGDYKTDAQSAERAYQQQQQIQQRQANDDDGMPANSGVKVPTYCYKFGNMVTCNK